jgi:hypothetical protein
MITRKLYRCQSATGPHFVLGPAKQGALAYGGVRAIHDKDFIRRKALQQQALKGGGEAFSIEGGYDD